MMLIPLEIPPGVRRGGTDMQSSGRWRDANLVRWREAAMQPVGGWRSFGDTTLAAAPRGALSWTTSTGAKWLAFGTFEKLHVIAGDGTTSDVTPAGFTSGTESPTVNTGWGGGFWGRGTWGTPRPETGNVSNATVWSMDHWGENLIACSPDDGKIYEWTLSTGTPAAAVANAPTSCTAAMVSERFLIALGADGDDRTIQWSDREDNTTWTPSSTNEAGSIQIETQGRILAGRKLRGEIIVLTDTDAHVGRYLGAPFVWGFEAIGTSCGLAAPAAVAVLDSGAYWMGKESFYRYLGGAVEPLPCEVEDYVFANLNTDQLSKAHAVTNSNFNEVWWFYCSSSSTEIDRYVSYDTKQNIWMIGEMDRTAAVDNGAAKYPVWFDSDGAGYQHEIAAFSWGASSIYAETGPISLGVGESTYSVTELIPDEKTQGDVAATFKARMHPNDTERTYGPYSMSNPTSVRVTGRQVRFRVDALAMADWRVGIPRLRVAERGRR